MMNVIRIIMGCEKPGQVGFSPLKTTATYAVNKREVRTSNAWVMRKA